MAVIQTTGDVDAVAAVHASFDAQRAAFLRDRYPKAAERRERVCAVADMVMRYRLPIREALSDDFGSHPALFADLGETLRVARRARHAAEHLEAWMAPTPREVDSALAGSGWAEVRREPKGVIGSIVPWTAPFELSLGSLVDILAAGNRAIVKPSHRTPACAELLREMVRATFNRDLVDVAVGGLELAQRFPRLGWDHVLYFGGRDGAREVALAAAENLVPVTLGVGGKCPAVVLEDAVDAATVEHIVGAKMVRNGQACGAVDHCFVPRRWLDDFVRLALAYVARTQPDYSATSDCVGAVSGDHLARTLWLLDEARDAGCTVVRLDSGGAVDRRARRVPLWIVVDPAEHLELMHEEILAPILPLHPYDTLDEAIARINARERPPAVFVFSHDGPASQRVLSETSSGVACVNAAPLPGALPSVGVTRAGGRLQGMDGFQEFTNARTFFVRGGDDRLDLLFPPYGDRQAAFVDDALAVDGARRFARLS
jgi:coniferyl-aldehyde dehydrogenase